MKKFFVLAVILAVLLFPAVGCVTLPVNSTSICDQVPEGQYSVICMVAERLNMTPEMVGGIIKVGNITALAGEVYTAQDALNFIEDVTVFLEKAKMQGITYALAYKAAEDKYLKLPPATRAAFTIATEVFQADLPEVNSLNLSEFDYVHLFAYLESQKNIIEPFLIE